MSVLFDTHVSVILDFVDNTNVIPEWAEPRLKNHIRNTITITISYVTTTSGYII
jgi:hypothetical protein